MAAAPALNRWHGAVGAAAAVGVPAAAVAVVAVAAAVAVAVAAAVVAAPAARHGASAACADAKVLPTSLKNARRHGRVRSSRPGQFVSTLRRCRCAILVTASSLPTW